MKPAAELRLQLRLRAAWIDAQELLETRMAVLDAAAASPPSLGSAQRAAALMAAHNLAGSLGMFGLHDGSECARRLEGALSRERPDGAQLLRLVRRLRLLVRQHNREVRR